MPPSVEQPRPTLQSVLKKLEPFAVDPLGFVADRAMERAETHRIKSRSKEIHRLIDTMSQNPDAAHTRIDNGLALLEEASSLPQHFQALEQFYKQSGEKDRADKVAFYVNTVLQPDKRDQQRALEEFREYMENALAAYLMHVNRSLFDRSTFKPEMEERQIEAVAALLSGNHLHLGTGEGKSAVVLPVVGIVKSLVSHEQEAILSTGNEQLLEPLRQSVQNLLTRVRGGNGGFSQIDLNLQEDPEKQPDPIPPEILQRMQKEALLNGFYSEETKAALRDNYWTQKFETALSPREKTRTAFLNQQQTGHRRITFLTERQLVFAYMEDKQLFKKKAPAIIMDEGHIPYDRGTPYETELPPFFHSVEDINQSVAMWLANFIVARHLKPDDFYYHKGVYTLDDGARERIKKQVNLRHRSQSVEDALSEGVGIVARSLRLTDEEKERLADQMKSYFKIRLLSLKRRGAQESPMEGFVSSIADTIATIYKAEGKSFVFGEKDQDPQLRDSYLDEVLKDHTHQPDVQTAIYALFSRFTLVPTLKQADQVVTFESFVADNADKVACASGSLLYRDLATDELRRGGFGHFIEWATKRPIHLIESLNRKKAPEPLFYETHQESIRQLALDVAGAKKEGKPGLIVCFDRNEGEEIYQSLSQRLGKDRVVYVPLNPKPEDVQRYCTLLADGKLDAIVTAGNLGVGVDIKKSDGTFPDLKVFIHGLPMSQLQIWQAIGRRRLEGNDAAWYIGHDQVEEYISHFEWKLDLIPIVDQLGGKLSREEVEKRVQIAIMNNDLRKNLELAVRIIRENEKGTASNSEIRILYNRLYERLVQKADKLLREKVAKERPGNEEVIDWLWSHYGLPESLYWTVSHWASFPSIAQRSGMMQTVHQDRDLINTWLTKKAYDELPDSIDQWMRLRRESVNQFRDIVYKGGKLVAAVPLQFSPSHHLVTESNAFVLTHPTGERSGFGYIFIPGLGYRFARLDENGAFSIALLHEGESMEKKLERGEEQSIDYNSILSLGLHFQILPTSLTTPEVKILLLFAK